QPDGGVHLSIRLTQGDIASLIGASREHINRVMVSYKERDYLSIDSNYHITIHNLQALARRCCTHLRVMWRLLYFYGGVSSQSISPPHHASHTRCDLYHNALVTVLVTARRGLR